jgi:glutaredoxin 3
MRKITVYTTSYCPYCIQAKRILNQHGLVFEEVGLDGKDELRQKLSLENNGYRTVPMIFFGDTFIGGYTELRDLIDSGKHTSLLQE